MFKKIKDDSFKNVRVSVSCKLYGSNLLYLNLEKSHDLNELIRSFKNPFYTVLYQPLSFVRNIYFTKNHIKKPLINGLEFNQLGDYGFSLIAVSFFLI